ncbi:hypothetical protein B0T18DRAFT_397500, partial [Schizothecium vesticola]
MGRITCSECNFDGCRDSCLNDHKRDFACHNKLCPLHSEYSVALRDGKLLRRGKWTSSRRRESEDLPRRSSDRPRHSSRRPRSSSRRQSGGDRLFTRVMDGMLRRRETTSVEDDDDNRDRGPSISVRIRRGTRHVRPAGDDDNGGPGPSTSARIRRGTRYVRPQDDSDSYDSDSYDYDSDDSDSDEGGRVLPDHLRRAGILPTSLLVPLHLLRATRDMGARRGADHRGHRIPARRPTPRAATTALAHPPTRVGMTVGTSTGLGSRPGPHLGPHLRRSRQIGVIGR